MESQQAVALDLKLGLHWVEPRDAEKACCLAAVTAQKWAAKTVNAMVVMKVPHEAGPMAADWAPSTAY